MPRVMKYLNDNIQVLKMLITYIEKIETTNKIMEHRRRSNKNSNIVNKSIITISKNDESYFKTEGGKEREVIKSRFNKMGTNSGNWTSVHNTSNNMTQIKDEISQLYEVNRNSIDQMII